MYGHELKPDQALDQGVPGRGTRYRYLTWPGAGTRSPGRNLSRFQDQFQDPGSHPPGPVLTSPPRTRHDLDMAKNLALALVLLTGCATLPKNLADDPRQLASAVETACALAPKPLPAEVEDGCSTLPDALRMAADVHEAAGPIVARAKALLKRLG